MHLHIVEDPSCQTAWTDGQSLGYSPAFVDNMTQDQLKGLIAHEVMHCACGHCWRRDSREPKKWNQATDYAINDVLIEAGFALPAGGLVDAQFRGQFGEWIYDRLPDVPPDQQPQPGEVRDAPGADPADDDQQSTPGDGIRKQGAGQSQADWQQLTKQAAALAQGKMPASMRRALLAATASATDWRSATRRFVQEVCKADYSWTRPNPRYMAQGLYLPALHSQQLGRLAIFMDTSGSVCDDTTQKQFVGEINSIIAELQPIEVIVIQADAAVTQVDTYPQGELIDLSTHHISGGGGTDFGPAFAHLAEQDITPACAIYLTDLYGSFPDEAPAYPVLWAVYGRNDCDVPFGERIDIQ